MPLPLRNKFTHALRRWLWPAASLFGVLTETQAMAQIVVRGDLDGDLREAIEGSATEYDRPVRSRLDARRRAEAAAERVEQVLRSEGYYAYQIAPKVEGADPGAPVVEVITGPRFVLSAPQISWTDPPPAPPARTKVENALALTPGDPARAAGVIAAEGRIIAALRDEGYADAKAQPRDVLVDHAARTLKPEYRIYSGAIVRLDGVRTAPGSNTRTREGWIEGLRPWRGGATYRPDAVAELERRLIDTNVYAEADVSLAPPSAPTPDGLRPVLVTLRDRRPRLIELGASYSSEDGAGLDTAWTRYNALGRADTLRLSGRLSGIDSRLGASLSLPHWRRPRQTLTLQAQGFRERTDAYDQTGGGVGADVTRRFGPATSYSAYGASVEFSRVDEVREADLSPLGRDLVTAKVFGAVSLDRTDDLLDPRRGWRLLARAEPTAITGSDTLAFGRLETQATAYLPLQKSRRTVLAGRAKVGSLVGGSLPELPAPQRFYAGGGGSVRGYAYQAIGPRLANDTPRGGLSLSEASIELRQQVTDRWGAVAFVDAGAVGAGQTPGFEDLALGAGVGVRYQLGFGPIRIDVATPLNARRGDADILIYVSIGQSF